MWNLGAYETCPGGSKMAFIVRISDVVAQTGLPRSSLYAQVKLGRFPKPVKLGARSVGWRVQDIEAWIATRPEGGSWTETE
jgi:prophage regulatory protein